MQILSIGTVLKLKNGEQKLMITSRTPLVNENGTIGYFDYGACLYPQGQINQENYFFNKDNIDVIFYEGYCDDSELDCRKLYEKKSTT